MMTERLRYATKALATHGHDRLAALFVLLLGDRFDIVPNQTDRTLRLNRDALGQRKELVDLVDHLLELLVTAENDVFFLKIGGKLHGHEGVHASRADVIVAALRPRILPTAHRAMADVHHVL